MNSRIIPLNLPARAKLDRPVAGNPPTTRLESVVANCNPGLEVDTRNLDRRFFPGLIFDFVLGDDGEVRGAKLVALDAGDPAQPTTEEFKRAAQTLAKLLPGDVYIHALAQGEPPKCIALAKDDGSGMLDGYIVWRLVRSLEPGKVTLELAEYEGKAMKNRYSVTADRRAFQTPLGELSAAYPLGELTQSLCSPWQHDFRDCTCNYWASNRPDIALPAHPAAPAEREDPRAGSDDAEEPLLWLRWNQAAEVPQRPTAADCRPEEMDHYELNERWQDLAIVIEGRETRSPYSIGVVETAAPLPEEELTPRLKVLAGMEQALALEYLYARYSVRFDDPTLADEEQQHADFIAHELLAIAVSEMMHLRWANQLMWELSHRKAGQQYVPSLRVGSQVPGAPAAPSNGKAAAQPVMRKPEMRPLNQALVDFLAAEAPSGTLEGQYARIFATVRQDSVAAIRELVSRIIADGVSHYSRFLEIQTILSYYASPAGRPRRGTQPMGDVKLVRKLELGDPADRRFANIADAYRSLLGSLLSAYRHGDAEDREAVVNARVQMGIIDKEATALARQNIGVPFIQLAIAAADALGLPPDQAASPAT